MNWSIGEGRLAYLLVTHQYVVFLTSLNFIFWCRRSGKLDAELCCFNNHSCDFHCYGSQHGNSSYLLAMLEPQNLGPSL